MQALVTIALRDRDPVLHTLRVGLVHIGDDGVDLPAFRAFLLQRRIQYDPDSEKIVDTLEFHLLLFQLVINGMYGFGTPLDIELESCRCQLPLDRGDELGDIASRERFVSFSFRLMKSYCFLSVYFKERSSSSLLIVYKPVDGRGERTNKRPR